MIEFNQWLVAATTAIGVLTAALVAFETARRAAHAACVLKTVDVTIHCWTRYEALARTRLEIESSDLPVGNGEAEGPEAQRHRSRLDRLSAQYDRSYWSLKSDQFDYWLYGVLDHDTFYDWTHYLTAKFRQEALAAANPETPATDVLSLTRSWETWTKDWNLANHAATNTRFVAFTDKLLAIAQANVQGASEAVDLRLAVLDEIAALEGRWWWPGFSRR